MCDIIITKKNGKMKLILSYFVYFVNLKIINEYK